MEDTPPGIASRRIDSVRAMLDAGHTEALNDRQIPIGARIRELYFISKPHAPGDGEDPDEGIYDGLADEAQTLAAGREFYRGMASGYELRIEHLENTIRDLRRRTPEKDGE